MTANKKLEFEQAMKQLEEIVDTLEKNEMPLETAVELFQQGIELSKYCSNTIDKIERKISVIIQDSDGNISEQDFYKQNESEE